MGDDGIITITGLHVSDYANGQPLSETDAAFQRYDLIATDAPDANELRADPIPFTVLSSSPAYQVTLIVEDIKEPPPDPVGCPPDTGSDIGPPG